MDTIRWIVMDISITIAITLSITILWNSLCTRVEQQLPILFAFKTSFWAIRIQLELQIDHDKSIIVISSNKYRTRTVRNYYVLWLF